MSDEQIRDFERVFHQIPSGLFVMTTAHDGHRAGVLARWVQRCSIEPPMIMVAIPKGQAVEPLILDSRSFAICRINPDDRLMLRKFTDPLNRNDDPFDAISTANAPSGSPLIDRAYCWLDCEVARHIELEADHRVYVGEVHHASEQTADLGFSGLGRVSIGEGNGHGNGNGASGSGPTGQAHGQSHGHSHGPSHGPSHGQSHGPSHGQSHGQSHGHTQGPEQPEPS